DERLRRALAYARSIPPAIEGQNGDNATFRAACKVLRGFGLSADECFTVLDQEFNPRCQPPWTPSDLQEKIRNAERYGQEPIGGKLAGTPQHNAHHGTATDDPTVILEGAASAKHEYCAVTPAESFISRYV